VVFAVSDAFIFQFCWGQYILVTKLSTLDLADLSQFCRNLTVEKIMFTSFSLPFSELSIVGLAVDLVD